MVVCAHAGDRSVGMVPEPVLHFLAAGFYFLLHPVIFFSIILDCIYRGSAPDVSGGGHTSRKGADLRKRVRLLVELDPIRYELNTYDEPLVEMRDSL